MSLTESYYNFMKKPYYEVEIFIDENRRIATEIHPVNGQTTINSKQFKGKSFYIPKSYNPDIIGYKRRVKFFVENAFPRVDPGTYWPSEDYEVLTEIRAPDTINAQGELVKGEIQYLSARSDFLGKIMETKITEEIIAEPPNKWEWLQPIIFGAMILIGIYMFFGVVLPGLR